MLKHDEIWAAIDALAVDHGLTASGLARRAGLDPTTFNKSKRQTREGKQRWPSTESISKILDATGVAITDFMTYIAQDNLPSLRTLPLLNYGVLEKTVCFDGLGHPSGTHWDEIPQPDISDPFSYALEISDNDLEPVYRDGDVLIVSPSANVRRGDRVIVCTIGAQIFALQLVRQTARRVEFIALGEGIDSPRSFAIEEVAWMHRIVWVSQ